MNLTCVLISCKSFVLVESHALVKECVNEFMSESENNLNLYSTLRLNELFGEIGRRQWRERVNPIENQNNQGIPANQNAQEQNPTYLAHDLDRPLRSYALPNLYDFNLGITYPRFSKNSRFEIKLFML